MDVEKQFLDTFNSYYPFERYIIKDPKPISGDFDDILLSELFVKNVEIKPILNGDGSLAFWTKIGYNDVCVKVIINGVEARLAYFDFNDHIREEIRYIFLEDFGEWESLYVEYETEEEYEYLKNELKTQIELIKDKYGECKIKEKFNNETTIKILKSLGM